MNKKLWNRDFILVIIGQIISLFGNAILRFALPLYLLKLTGSAAVFGTVMAISALPALLLTPVGGAIADRVNKRDIMVVLDFLTSGLILVLFFVLHDSTAVPVISVAMMCLTVISCFYQPAVNTTIPALCAEEHLLQGNSIVNTIASLANLIGPILGGILYAMMPVNDILLISCVCFAFSAIMEIFIKIPHVKRPWIGGMVNTIWLDFKESLFFIVKKQKIILKAIVLCAVLNMSIGVLMGLGVTYLVNIKLGLGSQLYAITQSAMGLGGLLGGLLVATLGEKLSFRKMYRTLLIISAALLPVILALIFRLPVMVTYWIIVAWVFITVISCTMFSISAITFVQRGTPQELIGKVLAVAVTIASCATPVGNFIYGFLFDAMSNSLYLIFLGTFLICMSIFFAGKQLFKEL